MKISNFIPVTGQELYDQMYDKEHDILELEEVIEDIYKMQTFRASNGLVWTTKRGFYNSREITDGYMIFKFYNEEFIAILEIKRLVANTENQYKKQLLQALRYAWLYHNDKAIKFFILASEKFYVYVNRKDVEKLIAELDPLFKTSNKSACKSWEDLKLREVIKSYSIPFHSVLLKDLRLDLKLKEIYKAAA